MPQPQVLSFEDALANHTQTAPPSDGFVSFDDALASAGQSADTADTPKQWKDMTPDEQKTLVASRRPQVTKQFEANQAPGLVDIVKRRFQQSANPPNPATRTPGDVATDAMMNVVHGANIFSGNGNTQEDTIRQIEHPTPAAPDPVNQTIMGNPPNPDDPAWAARQKQAGTELVGMAAGPVYDKAASAWNSPTMEGPRTRAAAKLQTWAGTNRQKALSPVSSPGLIESTLPLVVDTIAGHKAGGAALALEAANRMRKTPTYLKAKAGLQEGLSKAVSPKPQPTVLDLPEGAEVDTPSPRFGKPPVMDAVGRDATTTVNGTRLPAEEGGKATPSPQPENRPPVAEEPTKYGQFPGQPPSENVTPGEVPRDPEIDRFINELRHETEAQRRFEQAKENAATVEEPDFGARYPWEQEQKMDVARPEPQAVPTRDEMGMRPENPLAGLEEGITPVGKGKQRVLRFGPELDKVAPHLKDIPKGPEFDKALYQEFKNKEQGVIDADNNTPDETPVDKKPIIEHWQNMEDDYASRGLAKHSGAMQKLIAKWNDLPDQIPYRAFRNWKRAFFEETNTPMMQRAYRALSDASSRVSPELAKANREYYLTRSGLEAGNFDIKTGRRIAQVGKPPVTPKRRF